MVKLNTAWSIVVFSVLQVGRKKETYGLVDESDFAQLPADIARTASSSGLALYRCRKCRAVACTAANVLPVDAAMGHKHFRERRYVFVLLQGCVLPHGRAHEQQERDDTESQRGMGRISMSMHLS